MKRLISSCLILSLFGCASTSTKTSSAYDSQRPDSIARFDQVEPGQASTQLHQRDLGSEIVMYAMGLIDVGYVFGGKNPEAGLDCSGMVSFIYRNAANMDLRGSAADIAKLGKPIKRNELQAGDLVFFNTLHRPFSHVGIYIGDGRFVHAPSTNGRVRIESLSTKYFTDHYQEARSFFVS